ncbi:hypothetical protein HZS_7705 [Henneguya salminicola]|nr:hypothetical protein HZS_7705 [Henneguya salminicola]
MERYDCNLLIIGVPFILKAGKALRERKAEIRIQFKQITNRLFEKSAINELVMRMQPDEAIYLKMLLKMPGDGFEMQISELDLTYKHRHKEYTVQDAYEKLILDVINGSHINFVRSDELEESWKIFTPLIKRLEKSKIVPYPYIFGR